MTTARHALIVGLLAGAALASSCSSDDSSDGGSSGAGGTAGASGDAQADSSVYTGPIDQCANPSDMAARIAPYCVEPPFTTELDTWSSEQIGSQCGVECAFNADRAKCNEDCIQRHTDNAFSDECVSCIVQTILCASKHCLNECLSDPLSTTCLECRCGNNFPDNKNCVADFDLCTGLDIRDCEELEMGVWEPRTFEDLPECSGSGGAAGAGGSAGASGGSAGASGSAGAGGAAGGGGAPSDAAAD